MKQKTPEKFYRQSPTAHWIGNRPKKNWTTGQLASHIAEVYNWYESTFNKDIFDMGTYKYDKGDISKAENILAKFEENVANAQKALEKSDEKHLFQRVENGNGRKCAFPSYAKGSGDKSFSL
ncbi:hypothetical protein MUB42_03180 [Apilactobacillus kunkeei]|nr:hypothetical protein MUB42_03180 [Apilactobacillus kunkeei]